MIIDTQIVLKDLAGKDIKNEEGLFTLGKALSTILVSSEAGGKMKLFILGQKLFQDKKVEVDEADLNLMKEAIKSSKIYTALVSGQCEVLLENIKEDKKK